MKKKIKFPLISGVILFYSALIGVSFSSAKFNGHAIADGATAICQGVANEINNNSAETKAQGNPVPIYRTLLKYDVDLGSSANEVNVASSTGKGIKLNGVPLSDIPNTRVDYANGTKYIRIKIPQSYQDALTGTITLEVVEGTAFENKILDGIKFVLKSNGMWSKVSPVTFTEIRWNNIGYNNYSDKKGVLLGFSANLSKTQSEIDGGIQSTNFASTVGEHIYLGGRKLSTLTGAFVSYHSQFLLFIYADDMPAYRTLEIEDGTIFLDSVLPQVDLYFNVSTSWTTTPKTYDNVSFDQIYWNDTGYNFYVDKKGILLGFSSNLSKLQTEIDAGIEHIDFSSTVGEHIILGDKKLSTLPGAFVSYHSQNLLFIYADNMPSYRTLKIEAGTQFIDVALPELTLYYTTTSKWSLEKEPATPIGFSTIMWNNAGYDVHEGKNGLMLSYNDNLSNASNEIHGGIKTVNYASSSAGESIKLDGVSLKDIPNSELMYYGSTLLWIYVPNMQTYKELTIESCEFLTVILPESHFAFFENEWAEAFQIKNVINGIERVENYKKNSKITLGEDYYAGLFSDAGLSLRLISFQVGSVTYYQGQTFEISDDTTVNVIAVGFKTTSGASIRMNEPSGIRFENKISSSDYDYIVETYGAANIETGTYIVKKDNLSLTSFDAYFNNPNKIEGVDYYKVANKGFLNGTTAALDGYYKYYGTLDGITADDYVTEYCGIGYIKIKDGNNEYTLYGSSKLQTFSRSIYDVIKNAYKDYPFRTNENSAFNAILDGIVPLVSSENGLQIERIISSYLSPYSIKCNNETGEYIVTGQSEIKTVLINDEKVVNNETIVKVNNTPCKVTNFNLQTSNNESTLTFKLAPIVKAETLVDFVVQIPEDREMRILQITDTQIIDSSQIRHEGRIGETAIKLWSRANIDKNCFNHIAALIEKEQPDLILFTGDIVYGEFDDSGEILTRMVEFLDSFDIPWAPVFGNHDNETNMGVDWQCQQFENAKNCLFKQNNLTGNGNYSIGLVDSKGQIKRTIYMLDSNGCIAGASIGQDQLTWMKNTSAAIDNAYDKKIPSFACYHIPSLDVLDAIQTKYGCSITSTFDFDVNGQNGDFGQKKENLCTFGAYIASDLKSANVDGVFFGHDHVNNFSVEYDGIRYTYGTKTGIYDYYNGNMLGGTKIILNSDNSFDVSHTYLKESDMNKKVASSTTFTVFSDLHHDSTDYGGFHCTKTKEKLKRIVNETQSSQFYLNLGDSVNSLEGSLKKYYEIMSEMKELNLDLYNSEGTGYSSGNRMVYNLLGNHEVAYASKDQYKGYVPYVEGIGSAAVFKRNGIMFVAVDALFDRATGSDDPSDIITCTSFTIPNAEINWLRREVANKMDGTVEGIVWFSHVALQDIDSTSKETLLGVLKTYGLPMTVFEGHTHIENYQELIDSSTGSVYCQVYTLPAVTLNETYPYYNVTFRNGRVWAIDKLTGGSL